MKDVQPSPATGDPRVKQGNEKTAESADYAAQKLPIAIDDNTRTGKTK